MYLVDTNVISAAAPTKAQPMPDLARWMDRNSQLLYLSVITVAEVESGIAKARRQAATSKADQLAAWLQTVLHLYSPRILPLNITVAPLLGQLSDHARGAGQASGRADLAIAATSASRGYSVLTRNLRHFNSLSVPAHDPFESLPAPC